MSIAALLQPPPAISPDDRLPTFTEVIAFDAAAAWNRLSPAQQREVGGLAVYFAAVGGRLSYEHDYSRDEVGEIDPLADVAMGDFFDKTEPLWADLYGWRSQAPGMTA